MPENYTYELWDGKKVVGTITTIHPLMRPLLSKMDLQPGLAQCRRS